MTAITLKSLTRRFDDVMAVDDLSLHIESGSLVAFLGPSGCGKTTTLRMISGLAVPTGGDILFNGQSVLNIPSDKRGAGMVFQQRLLFPMMSVAQNIAFGLKMQRVKSADIERRVHEMLELVQLPGYGDRRPHELSGGQQQRVALARALVVQPTLLLLDEPLASLDANLRLDMRELIRDIQKRLSMTMIFVTHDQEEAVMLADKIALLFEGRLQQYDRPQAFYQCPRTADVARFFRNENFLPAHRQDNHAKTAIGQLRINPDQIMTDAQDVLLTIRPEDIRLHPESDENIVQARVKQEIYMGTYTQVQLEVGDQLWMVHTDTDSDVTPGNMISVQLPAERICLLPLEKMAVS